jgi:hypothetical protein
MRWSVVLVVFVLVVFVGSLAVGCGGPKAVRHVVGPVRWPVPGRTGVVARRSACSGARAVPFDYGWPIRPFDVQHPIRANFGDPRTISAERLGLDDRGDPGDYSFHNGVDISAKPGTPVFPVVSGVAALRHANEVIVHVPGGLRNFQYWHITPRVHDGERVIAYRTVLGTVQAPAKHVHLTEIDGDHVTNPARHLRPYDDRTAPVVDSVTILDSRNRAEEPQAIGGAVSISAGAADTPPVPVPGAWHGFPVTPAIVQWTLSDASGRQVIPLRTVADFHRFQPPQRDFWNVYAAGTYQNFPDFDHHFYWRQPGRYLFKLTRRPLITTRLPNGVYRLRVSASDICGNRGTLNERLRIVNP